MRDNELDIITVIDFVKSLPQGLLPMVREWYPEAPVDEFSECLDDALEAARSAEKYLQARVIEWEPCSNGYQAIAPGGERLHIRSDKCPGRFNWFTIRGDEVIADGWTTNLELAKRLAEAATD